MTESTQKTKNGVRQKADGLIYIIKQGFRALLFRHEKFLLRLARVGDPIYVWFYKLIYHPYLPVPPLEHRIKTGYVGIKKFFESGRFNYQQMKKAILTCQNQPLKEIKILDFGVGAGRVMQYFYNECPFLFATDVNEPTINYLLKVFPKIKISCNHCNPPLDYPDNYFDVVYSVSVWTHLSPTLQKTWLEELHRILRPNGLAIITFTGPYNLKKTIATDSKKMGITPEELDKIGMFHYKYPFLKSTAQFPGVDQEYGRSFHTADYIRKNWNNNFDILYFEEGVIDNLQDLVVLKNLP